MLPKRQKVEKGFSTWEDYVKVKLLKVNKGKNIHKFVYLAK